MAEYTFAISLANLHGDSVNTRAEYLTDEPEVKAWPLRIGDTVYAVDEDDERYLAVVESIKDNGWLTLCLKSAPTPKWTSFHGMSAGSIGAVQSADSTFSPQKA